MEKDENKEIKFITISDILKGIIFVIVVFGFGKFLILAIQIGIIETIGYLASRFENKIFAGLLLLVAILVMGLLVGFGKAIESGFPLHTYLKRKQKKDRTTSQ
jgi:hypothetical protein